MYGLINKAVRALIVSHYGEATWLDIVKLAGCQALFISNTSYPDETTYALVGAASEVLKVPAPDLLERVGLYWVSYTRQHGYKSLFDIGGSSLPEFLCNLNAMHTHIQAQFPKLRMPTFWCTDIAPQSLTLHYRPGRPTRNGLAPLVVGLMKGLADLFHLEEFEIEHTGKRSHHGADDDDGGADFDVFLLRWEGEPSSLDSSIGGMPLLATATRADLSASTASIPDYSGECPAPAGSDENDKLRAFEARWQFCLPPTRFAAAFPFHLVLSQDLKIVQAGEVLQRLCPEMALGSDFGQHWRVVRPEMVVPVPQPRGHGTHHSEPEAHNGGEGETRDKSDNGGVSFQAIKDNRDLLFLLESKHNKRLKLRGQMNVISSTEGCQVSNSGGTLRRKAQPPPPPPQQQQPTQQSHTRERRQTPRSPRCPMSLAASPRRSTTLSVSPACASSASATATPPGGCPMTSLMSSSSSTSVGRRKKKTLRSISDPATDGKKKRSSTDRARRPEEDDSDLTDSNRSVICAPPAEETIIKADGDDGNKPTVVVAAADHYKQHKTKKSSKRARAKQTLRLEEFVFFLGSVQVKDNEEVVELGLSLHDFALHDAVKEVLVLAASNETTMRDVHQMEEFILYGMDGGSGAAGAGGARKGDPYDDSAISGSGRRPSIKPNAHTKNTRCLLS